MKSAACQVEDAKETYGEIRSGSVEPDRVEATLGEPRRNRLERSRALAPRLGGVVLVEPADVCDRLPEAIERLAWLEVGVDEGGPTGRGSGRDAPVRRPAVDDVARVRQVGKEVAARA